MNDETLEQQLLKRLRTRDGRSGRSPEAPMIGSLQRNFGFSARKFDDLGIVGTPRISLFVNDSFVSTCGRFLVIARDEFAENNTPFRLRTPGACLYRQELWADGNIVAKTQNAYFAMNWLMMKVKGAGFINELVLDRSPASLPVHALSAMDGECEEVTFERPRG